MCDLVRVLYLPGLHHLGGVQKLWWRHHPGRLLRLNPARLADYFDIKLQYQHSS